jgi:predicted nuclease with TOPRIM domain
MENKTITMPLSEYEGWSKRFQDYDKQISDLKEENEQLQNAKAVFIERVAGYDRDGRFKIDTLRPRIHGKGVELNKAIQELRDEVDKIHTAYSEFEIKTRGEQDLKIKQAMYTAELDIELDLIKSKWWYKLFSKL